MSCAWVIPWVGTCKNEAQGRFCDEHTNKVCAGCGKEAVKGCDATFGLVCGAPLCDGCVDEGRGRHVPLKEAAHG